MFQPWRIKLKAAQSALEGERLDEARAILCEGDLSEFLPARQLLVQLADRLAARGHSQAAGGDSLAGWQDLQAADQLGADRETVGALKQRLLHAALEETEAYLQADNPRAALDRLHRLEQRSGETCQTRQLKQVALRLEDAARLARRGRFHDAGEALSVAARLRPDWKWLACRCDEYRQRGGRCRTLREQMHAALSEEQWTAALAAAEELLELCPADDAARDARRQAWLAVGAEPKRAGGEASSPHSKLARMNGYGRHRFPRFSREAQVPDSSQSTDRDGSAARFMAWIDGVGSFLVCQADELVIGQPTPEPAGSSGGADIGILGDLSRRHAVIHRSGEGYLLRPRRECRVGGKPLTGPTALSDGSLIELGEGVQLRFRKPHPLSSSARLEFVSHHRTPGSVQAVILMAESCILGPGSTSHIRCEGLSHDVVLFRRGGQLHCRSTVPLEVDGRRCEGPAPITCNSHLVGDEISVTLEEI